MKRTVVTSRWYILNCGFKTVVLIEGQTIEFKISEILESWYDLYIDGRYNGTITPSEFKMNFRLDNLLEE